MRNTLLFIILISTQLFGGTVSKEYEKTFDFSKTGHVHVKNVNGNIDIESWNRDEVYVYADIEVRASSRHRANEFMKEVRIEVTRSNGRISIEPDHPKVNGGDFLGFLFGNSKPNVKVNFTIKVPRQITLDSRSVNGRIRVTGIDGEADLGTTNGQIDARDMGDAVSAKSTNGGLNIEIREWKSDKPVSLHTVNGGVQLTMPSDINADVNISTVNGGIHTDYPLKVEGEFNRKSLHGTINGGGPEITVKTVNGGIRLEEL